MAIYRNVHIDYWQDGFILDLTPEEKYFYIYLMTNSKTSQCGIYELPKKIIETETGYNKETVDKLLRRFEEYNKIAYNEDTKEIYLLNWIRHNKIVSPKVKKCVEKELSNIKSLELINLFLKGCNKYGYTLDLPTVDTKVNIEAPQPPTADISKFKTIYEQNVGLINGVVGEWLLEIADTLDYHLFKKAIEIATDRGRCNKGYINGILKQWKDNNINTIEQLNAYELSTKNRGDNHGKYINEHTKPKHAQSPKEQDDSLYRKPTEEELDQIMRELEDN